MIDLNISLKVGLNRRDRLVLRTRDRKVVVVSAQDHDTGVTDVCLDVVDLDRLIGLLTFAADLLRCQTLRDQMEVIIEGVGAYQFEKSRMCLSVQTETEEN